MKRIERKRRHGGVAGLAACVLAFACSGAADREDAAAGGTGEAGGAPGRLARSRMSAAMASTVISSSTTVPNRRI